MNGREEEEALIIPSESPRWAVSSSSGIKTKFISAFFLFLFSFF